MRFQPNSLLLAAGLLLAGAAAPAAAHAQVGRNAQAGRPAGPASAQYYYVPEIDGYYDLAARHYLVQRNGRWVPVATLPGYNPASFHPVAVSYQGREPWAQYRDHHARYYRPVVVRPASPPVLVREPRRPVVVEQVSRRGRVVAYRGR